MWFFGDIGSVNVNKATCWLLIVAQYSILNHCSRGLRTFFCGVVGSRLSLAQKFAIPRRQTMYGHPEESIRKSHIVIKEFLVEESIPSACGYSSTLSSMSYPPEPIAETLPTDHR